MRREENKDCPQKSAVLHSKSLKKYMKHPSK